MTEKTEEDYRREYIENEKRKKVLLEEALERCFPYWHSKGYEVVRKDIAGAESLSKITSLYKEDWDKKYEDIQVILGTFYAHTTIWGIVNSYFHRNGHSKEFTILGKPKHMEENER